MPDYSEKINNMTFSFSNFSTFESCKLLWKMVYLEGIERTSSWWAEFGLAMHETIEKYFKGEIESYEMLQYYQDNYERIVVSEEPTIGKNIGEKYYQQGIEFFSNFDFSREKYELINIEDKVETTIGDIKLVIKPDAVLRDKESKKIIILDHKTSNPYDAKGNIKKDKILPYLRQLQLYASILWAEKQIQADQLWLWFVRYNKIEKFLVDPEKAFNNLSRFLDIAEQIKNEKDFNPNTSNRFFCLNFCSYSAICIYKDIDI